MKVDFWCAENVTSPEWAITGVIIDNGEKKKKNSIQWVSHSNWNKFITWPLVSRLTVSLQNCRQTVADQGTYPAGLHSLPELILSLICRIFFPVEFGLLHFVKLFSPSNTNVGIIIVKTKLDFIQNITMLYTANSWKNYYDVMDAML